jgi:hypothetical protein
MGRGLLNYHKNCGIASGLPCYACRYARNDADKRNARHCERSEAISISQNLTALPCKGERDSPSQFIQHF